MTGSLSKDEIYFIEHILAFLAGADCIVLENIMTRFTNEITETENIHGQVYSLLIDTLIKDPERKRYLFNIIDEIPLLLEKPIGPRSGWNLIYHLNKE